MAKVVVVDPKLLCNDGFCRTQLVNMAVYRDRHHLNGKASAKLAQMAVARPLLFIGSERS